MSIRQIDEKVHKIDPYYEQFRSDVIDFVPSDARCILSVGCGAGRTEAELVKRGIKVVGVELNSQAAELASKRGVLVLEGDASEIDIAQLDEYYDCIIYADVLEHLPDPVSVLKHHVKRLKPGGIVYVCVPNFRHYSVFWGLFIRGHIRYKKGGILDRTHLKITSRKMVLEWFDQVDLRVLSCRYGIWGRRSKLLSACFFGLACEFIAHQIVLIAQKPNGQ